LNVEVHLPLELEFDEDRPVTFDKVVDDLLF